MFMRGGLCVMVALYKDGSYSACLSQIPPHMSFDPAQEVCMSEILIFGDYRQFVLLFTHSVI